MRVRYGEEVANHSDPESCGGAREGAAEALTGKLTGQALSRDIRSPECRRCYPIRKATRNRVLIASPETIPRGRRPCACRGTSCPEAGRSHPSLHRKAWPGWGRLVATFPRSTRMRSRIPLQPRKPPNKRFGAVQVVERRGVTKGNTGKIPTSRALRVLNLPVLRFLGLLMGS